MIRVIVSENCPYCTDQLEVMDKSFFSDEYEVIKTDSERFAALGLKDDEFTGVPFLVISDDSDGSTVYAGAGLVDGTSLRKIARDSSELEKFAKSYKYRKHAEGDTKQQAD